MVILGLNAYHADASVALVKDGLLVSAIEEERLNRQKHCAGFPTLAVRAALDQAGVRARLVGPRHPFAYAHFLNRRTRVMRLPSDRGSCLSSRLANASPAQYSRWSLHATCQPLANIQPWIVNACEARNDSSLGRDPKPLSSPLSSHCCVARRTFLARW